MRRPNKLTPLAVQRARRPGLYHDGHGLYLQVSVFGTKSWLYRFMRHGVARKMGLGALHTVPLALARQRAADARRALLDGIDPIDARKPVAPLPSWSPRKPSRFGNGPTAVLRPKRLAGGMQNTWLNGGRHLRRSRIQ
jgi:hypothetical protein